jgi:signal transduction histidine kinase
MKRMREISNNLMPSTLTRKGLLDAVSEFISRISKPKALDIRLQVEEISTLPLEKSIHLYRILQEIIHNTIKHSEATTLSILIRQQKNHILIEATDNGKGINENTNRQEFTGQGLRNLVSRTEILQGKMYLDSETGKGTKFSFDIPVNT